MVKRNETKQDLVPDPTHIIIDVPYIHKLILPVKDAMEFMRLFGKGLPAAEDWKTEVISLSKEKRPKQEFKYITEQQIREAQMASLVETEEEP